MQIDTSKSAAQNFLALYNADNPNGPTDPSQVTFSNLQAVTDGAHPAVNTQVTMTGTGTAVNHEDFTGTVTVEYGRLALSAEAASPTGSVDVPNGSTSAQILALVATYYGFILSEISWQTVPTAPGTLPGDTVETIQCSGSLLYLDGTASVNLHWQA